MIGISQHFITTFGSFRYTRAPQGFDSSGDGYNRRFSAILSDVDRKERCVDDTVSYDSELECHWWRTIDFLSKVGKAGIILNPKKFQFCQKSFDFLSFRISNELIEPLPKFQLIQEKCQSCNQNFPSQPLLPQELYDPPKSPLEKILADFFQFTGNNFLVVGYRLSGWTETFSTPSRTSQAGSHGLIKCLGDLFSRFGVPEEIST